MATGQRSTEEVLSYFKELFHSQLKKIPSFFWDELVCCCTSLYPEEVYPEIKESFAEGLINEFIIDLDYVDETLSQDRQKVLTDLQNKRYMLIEDTIKEIEWWSCFKPKPTEQVVKKRKIGRNEPCPCGSGKKYKKCCGA